MIVRSGVVYLGGVSAEELADRFGTPLYVLEPETVRQRYTSITRAISYRPLILRYAIKANPNVALVRYIHSLGGHVDACSPGDLAVADAAGIPHAATSYVGVGVADSEILQVAREGILFIADSMSQIERYSRIAPRVSRLRSLAIRLNPQIDAGFHSHVMAGSRNSKFGIHRSQVPDAVELAKANGVNVVGIHAHIGSDVFDVETPIRLLHLLIEASAAIDELEFVDVGGGWGVPFMPGDSEFDMLEYGRLVGERMAELSAGRGRPITLVMEPGAYLVSDAGLLLTRVTEIKEPVLDDEGWTPRFAGTDTSYNHVFSAAMYDSYHQILLADRADDPADHEYHVVGNLMQAGDVLAKNRPLPKLAAGDLLVIRNCGGYSSARATVFNGRPRPAEVMADGGKAWPTRRPETVTDLLSREVF